MNDVNDEARLREAIELLYFGYREFTAGADRILQRRGLNRVHHRILYFVGRNDGVSVGSLLDILAVSKQALNAPLRLLVKMRLITNENAAFDRRVKQLRLSADGRRLERRLSGTQMQQLARVFAIAGSTAEAGWRKVMREMRD